MPPLVTESDAESVDEEIILHRKASAKKQAKGDLPNVVEEKDEPMNDVVAETGGDEEEEGDDEEEEVYAVERILDHDFDFPDGKVRYEIKWLGYEKESDVTWETEENLQGAKEILLAYYESIGGKPQPGGKKPGKEPGKKRGRQSTGAVSSSEVAPKKAKLEKGETKSSGAGRGRKSKSSPKLDNVIRDEWHPPKPLPSAWEDRVVAVDTIESDATDRKWAYLKWADVDGEGKMRSTKALLSTCYVACPQVMLKFFESHLVFTDSSKKQMNGAH